MQLAIHWTPGFCNQSTQHHPTSPIARSTPGRLPSALEGEARACLSGLVLGRWVGRSTTESSSGADLESFRTQRCLFSAGSHDVDVEFRFFLGVGRFVMVCLPLFLEPSMLRQRQKGVETCSKRCGKFMLPRINYCSGTVDVYSSGTTVGSTIVYIYICMYICWPCIYIFLHYIHQSHQLWHFTRPILKQKTWEDE